MRAKEISAAAVPALPSDARIFGFPFGAAWFLLGCSVLFIGSAAFGVVLADVKPARGSLVTALCGLVFFGSLAAMSLSAFGRFRDRVAVSSTGIWYLPRKGQATCIAWSEVASVEAHETQQRLILRDAAGTRKIRLEYQLEDFSELREIVLRHTAALIRAQTAGIRVFHRSPINKIIILGLATPGAIMSGAMRSPLPLLFFSVPLVMVALCDLNRLVIGEDGLVLEYPLWKRRIPYVQIAGITLKTVAYRGNSWAAVIIDRHHGRSVKLFRFREGSPVLHEGLLEAWNRSGAPQTASS